MNYKETLFFVGKCLTITHEKHNKILIEKELKSGNVDWDNVVKLSTSHYVFPALYCNLKRADFLHYLPNDLVEYMKHITDLNRERNQQIIDQAKEINELLLTNNITPIFLKGTGNLLEGLYEDIGERMVGDIDFLVKKEHCKIAYSILLENNYNSQSISKEDHRHLPTMTNPNKISAIEIHKEILRKEKSTLFNYSIIQENLTKINNCFLLSPKNQIKLTIFNKLINDYQYLKKEVNLRAAYDYFLIGSKLLKRNTFFDEVKLKKELIAGLDSYSFFLSKPSHVKFNSTSNSKYYINRILKNLENNFITKLNRKTTSLYISFIIYAKIILKAFYKKSYLVFITSKITDINWYRRR